MPGAELFLLPMQTRQMARLPLSIMLALSVQSIIKSGAKPITIEFRAGTYFLSKTVEFTAADSGTSNAQITYENYPNETPIISGGVRVLNWTNAGGNTWKATLPASTKYFENLFYNGVRRLRPRLGGYLGTYLRFADTVYLNAPQPPASCTEPELLRLHQR